MNNITIENVDHYAFHNINVCEKPFRGIILAFLDKDASTLKRYIRFFAKQGIIFLVPKSDTPSLEEADGLLKMMFEEFHLRFWLPVLCLGENVGIIPALTYAKASYCTPKAVFCRLGSEGVSQTNAQSQQTFGSPFSACDLIKTSPAIPYYFFLDNHGMGETDKELFETIKNEKNVACFTTNDEQNSLLQLLVQEVEKYPNV